MPWKVALRKKATPEKMALLKKVPWGKTQSVALKSSLNVWGLEDVLNSEVDNAS
jgi:hypothetical protein